MKEVGACHIIVNNAGIQIPASEIADQSVEDYDRISAINQCAGPYCACRMTQATAWARKGEVSPTR